MRNERAFLQQLPNALAALARTTGVEGRVVARETQTTDCVGEDARIEFIIKGKTHRYAVEAKTRVDRLAALGHIKNQVDRPDTRGLLFAPYITATIAKQCRTLDLAFLDTAGNAYLNLPGLYIYITGEKPEGLATPALGKTGGGTPTALRAMFALLCKPALLNAPYREIVEATGVALGAIGWIFLDLEARGHVAAKQRNHNRRLLAPQRLFDEWVTNYPIKLRPKLNPRRFIAEDPDWWKTADLNKLGAYWGGEVAAAKLTKFLKPAACTIYCKAARMRETLNTLVANYRMRADPNGNIEVLDAFWNLPGDREHPDVVPPILVYADLVATLNPRNLETAKLVHEKYIAHALRQA
jgi:hypothetical protein